MKAPFTFLVCSLGSGMVYVAHLVLVQVSFGHVLTPRGQDTVEKVAQPRYETDKPVGAFGRGTRAAKTKGADQGLPPPSFATVRSATS